MEIPGCKDKEVFHKYAKIDGILSFYNFFNTKPDFNIQTRIFSRQVKYIINLKPKIETATTTYLQSSTIVLNSIGKIKDVKYVHLSTH